MGIVSSVLYPYLSLELTRLPADNMQHVESYGGRGELRGNIEESAIPVPMTSVHRKSGWVKQVAGGLKGGSPSPEPELVPGAVGDKEIISQPSEKLKDTALIDR